MMIGLFDTGHGGLTIYRALKDALPEQHFMYLGDHAHAPYGMRDSAEILSLTKAAVMQLFERGCKLVILACNTATAVALRRIQQEWLPASAYKNNRVLGIIAPTVEMATGIGWLDQDAQNHAQDLLAVFGTQATITSGVYDIEIRKRSPNVEIITQICLQLAGAIEEGLSDTQLERLVATAVQECLEKTGGRAPQRAILGCTHFPIVEHHFEKHLPATTQILSQGPAVVLGLKNYLERHPEFNTHEFKACDVFLTSGNPELVRRDAQRFLGMNMPFETIADLPIL